MADELKRGYLRPRFVEGYDPAIDRMSDRIDELEAEVERLRAAIDALLTDIDGDHRPEWSSDEAEAAGKEPWCCAWCGAADGGWPCVHRRALDELKAARRG